MAEQAPWGEGGRGLPEIGLLSLTADRKDHKISAASASFSRISEVRHVKCIALTEDREEGDPGAQVLKMSILQRAESKKSTRLSCFFEDGEVLRPSNEDIRNWDCFSLV